MKNSYVECDFRRVVLNIEKRIFESSSASLWSEKRALSVINSVSFRRDNQYFVSSDSLYAIEILEEKSDGDIAPLASEMFAPIEVPLQTNCLERTNSLFSSIKYRCSFTVRT